MSRIGGKSPTGARRPQPAAEPSRVPGRKEGSICGQKLLWVHVLLSERVGDVMLCYGNVVLNHLSMSRVRENWLVPGRKEGSICGQKLLWVHVLWFELVGDLSLEYGRIGYSLAARRAASAARNFSGFTCFGLN